MKKSVNIWSFGGSSSLAEKLRLAKQAGFEGFEIDLSADGPLNLGSSPGEITAIRRLADSEGIELSGLATGLYWGDNPASRDPAVRGRAAAILASQISAARQLGVDAVLVVPGSVGVDFIPDCEVVRYDEAWERATTFIRDALPAASKARVRLCIENVWNKFLLSPLEMRSFIDQFGSEWVGSYFDVGNSLATGYPEQWISILGDRIRRVHFKDFRRAVGTVDGFVELLSGNVDWPAVMAALRNARYEGWITAEMIPPVPFYRHSPETLIHNTSTAMDALLRL